MEIKVRRITRYKDVKVVLDNTTIELGLMDEDDCMAMARKLKSAIHDLIGDTDKYKAFLEVEE